MNGQLGKCCKVGETRFWRSERNKPYYRSQDDVGDEFKEALVVDGKHKRNPDAWKERKPIRDRIETVSHYQSRTSARHYRPRNRNSKDSLGSVQSPVPVRNMQRSNRSDFSSPVFRKDRNQMNKRSCEMSKAEFNQSCSEMGQKEATEIKREFERKQSTQEKDRRRSWHEMIDDEEQECQQQKFESEDDEDLYDFSEMSASGGDKSWYEIVEEEELETQQQQLEAKQTISEKVDNRACHRSYNHEQKDQVDSKLTSSRRRRNSTTSSLGSHCSENSELSDKSLKKISQTPRFTEDELQTEEVRLLIARRKKQVEYGQTQECYQQYLEQVPRNKRTKFHPRTPDIHCKYSRRGFDMLVRIWKKQLHAWDPKNQTDTKKNK